MIKRVLSCVLCALSLPWVLTAEGFNSWQEFDAWVISNYVAMADGRGCIPPARPVFYHAMGAFPFAEAGFSDLTDATLPTIKYGVPTYDVRVRETNDVSRVFIAEVDGIGLHTNQVPYYDTQEWSRLMYNEPPAWLAEEELLEWYEFRARDRIGLSFTFVPEVYYDLYCTNLYIAATNRAAQATQPEATINTNQVAFSAVTPDVERQMFSFQIYAPHASTLDLFTTTNLLEVPWTYAGTVQASYPYSDFAILSPSTTRFLRMTDSTLDTDGDGIPDGMEAFHFGTNSNQVDTAGSLLTDWEKIYRYGLDPLVADSDDDGLVDGAEIAAGTSPLNGDTDDDGISDGEEIEQGTSPLDPIDIDPIHVVSLTGHLPQNIVATTNHVVILRPQTTYLFCVFVASEEYPYYTDYQSEFNDELTWQFETESGSLVQNAIQVNDEDGAWSLAETNEWGIAEYSPVVLKEAIIYANGDARLPLTITLGVKNVADDLYPSTVMVYAYPLRVVQHNMPHAGGVDGSTDLGDDYKAKVISRNGVAYITGAPQPAQLTAEFKGAPEWLPIQWRGTLETERSDHRFEGIDNRTFIPLTNSLYNITTAFTNEVIGGACDLQFSVQGLTNELACGSFPFYIRGKNPKDATAKAYITANVDSEFQDIAWMIAKHESKSGSRCYNQFNPGVGQYSALPNWGSPHGWGMCQIDKRSNGVHTVILYDWHKNVEEMNKVLLEKKGAYNRLLKCYQTAYPNLYFEPDESITTNINGKVISARQWALLNYYNGAAGCKRIVFNGIKYWAPIHLNPETAQWEFHTNNQNYAPKVLGDRDITPTE